MVGVQGHKKVIELLIQAKTKVLNIDQVQMATIDEAFMFLQENDPNINWNHLQQQFLDKTQQAKRLRVATFASKINKRYNTSVYWNERR